MMKTLFLFYILTMTFPGKRQVLIFYNEEGITKKNEQIDLLQKNKQGVLERDITINTYHISEAKEEVNKWNISSSSTFTFILVGKDGSEKMKADTVVSADQLFAKIDAMPMRKQEMKDGD